MAGMNLNPTPVVIAVQTVTFLATMYSVKKLFVEPFLRLKDKRDNATINQKSEAQKLVIENEELSSTLHMKFDKARDEIHGEVEKIREEMKTKRESIFEDADKKAKNMLAKVRDDVEQLLNEERAKMSSSIPTLAQELYSKTIN